MANTVKKPMSWGLIIFLLFIVWPLGLFLLIRRFNNKSALMSGKTRGATVAAWVLIVIGGFMLFTMFSAGDFILGMFLYFAALVIGGILILTKLKQSERVAELYRKYLNAIVNVGERSIDNIASAVSVPYETAKRDIQSMIDYGLLKNAHIHEGNRTVVLAQDIQAQQPIAVMQSEQMTVTSHGTQSMTTRCTGCGANNTVTSRQLVECEYCGIPLA